MQETKKAKILVVVAAVLLIATVAVALFCVFGTQDIKGIKDSGASITQAQDGESEEEIKERLNEQVRSSMMKITCASKCEIKDGKVKVGVKNNESNTMDQSFELIQNGETLYSSGLISPGEQVVWCQAQNAQAGSATITIHAHKDGSADNYGNAQSAQIELYVDDDSK